LTRWKLVSPIPSISKAFSVSRYLVGITTKSHRILYSQVCDDFDSVINYSRSKMNAKTRWGLIISWRWTEEHLHGQS
ncbi:hypothetical protein EUTSA_v10022206mg, partial [Eutrema salsugineum]